jgi:vacuolar-type H+-ATPase subunit I/STV1
MDTKEKDTEKVSTPTVETPKEISAEKVESKSEPIPEAPKAVEDKSEDTIKSLQGQISRLQKELNEKTDVRKQLQSLLGEDNAVSDVDPVEALNTRLQSLEKELSLSKAEIAKNSLIDSLEVAEPIKRYLKTRVNASSDNMEEVVKVELNSVQQLLESATPKTTDSRPKGLGAGRGDSTNMQYVLDHPELFKK